MSCRLIDLADANVTAPWIAAAGHHERAAAEKARRVAACAAAVREAGVAGDAAAAAFLVPGRIEVLGRHTDYAGGRTIIAAAEQGFCLVAAGRDDATVQAAALDLGEDCRFDISPGLTPPMGHWSNYPMTVARRVARNFAGPLRGATLAFSSDLPVAAGMSSSSALMVSVFHALSRINGLAERDEYRREITDAESLAGYLATIENGQSFGGLVGDKGVGTFGGSEDHVAMLCGRAGMLSQYSYCPVRLQQRVPFPAEHLFAIAASGVVAAKTGEAMAKYNRASALARAVVAAWNEATGRDDEHIAAVLESGELDAVAERMRAIVSARPADGQFAPDQLLARFEHFLTENEQIIPPAAAALAAGDLIEFGRRVDQSQRFAEELLGNQVPETSFLARSARELGAAAACSFGAGFGGSVWALVREDRAEAFLGEWARSYEDAFPEPFSRASLLLSRPGPAALTVEPSLA